MRNARERNEQDFSIMFTMKIADQSQTSPIFYETIKKVHRISLFVRDGKEKRNPRIREVQLTTSMSRQH